MFDQTRLHILHKHEDLGAKARTGVSLHCHTEQSKEMLDFVPHYAEKLPVINFFWKRERDKYEDPSRQEEMPMRIGSLGCSAIVFITITCDAKAAFRQGASLRRR